MHAATLAELTLRLRQPRASHQLVPWAPTGSASRADISRSRWSG